MFNHAVILAAGRGIRMMPLTKKIPKPLAIYQGQTLVERGIKKLKKVIKNIHITVGYKGTLVASHVIEKGVQSVVNNERKGNAWWIYNSILKYVDEPIIVLTCDNVIDININFLKKEYEELKKNSECILVAVKPDNRFDGDYLKLDKKKRILKISRKIHFPNLASGMQILNPYRLNLLTKKTNNFKNIWKQLLKKKTLYSTNIYKSKWLAIDSLKQLKTKY